MKRLTLIATSVLLAIGSPAFADITGLTIDNLGTFSESTGEARVSGTVTCTTAVSLRALAGQAQSSTDGRERRYVDGCCFPAIRNANQALLAEGRPLDGILTSSYDPQL